MTPHTQGSFGASSPDRVEILWRLRELVGEVLSTAPDKVDPSAPFLEMGADSIVLMVTLKRIEKEFGVLVSIRRLFDDLKTIDAVADFVVLESPIRHASEPVAQPDTEISAQDDSGLKALLGRQLAIMERQLAILEGKKVPDNASQIMDEAPTPALVTAPRKPLPSSNPLAPVPPVRNCPQTGGDAILRDGHIEKLMERYTKKTSGSKLFAVQNRKRLADCRAAAGFRHSTKEMLYPLVGSRAKGSTHLGFGRQPFRGYHNGFWGAPFWPSSEVCR